MSLLAIKRKFGIPGVYAVQQLQIKISNTKTSKIRMTTEDVTTWSKRLDLTNLGQMGSFSDDVSSESLFRGILGLAIKKKIFILVKKAKQANHHLTLPLEKKELKDIKGVVVKEREKFTPPTIAEAHEFFKGKKVVNAKEVTGLFYSHYESNGWKVGKNKMVKWKGAAAGWILRGKKDGHITVINDNTQTVIPSVDE